MLYVLSFLLAFAPLTQAELSDADSSALADTQALLKDQNQRNATKSDPQAASAIAAVEELFGPSSEEAFSLAADLFGDLVNRAGGDMSKIAVELLAARKNPEAFYKNLSPELKQKFDSLAKKAKERTRIPAALK